jgi:hypothetical protein
MRPIYPETYSLTDPFFLMALAEATSDGPGTGSIFGHPGRKIRRPTLRARILRPIIERLPWRAGIGHAMRALGLGRYAGQSAGDIRNTLGPIRVCSGPVPDREAR